MNKLFKSKQDWADWLEKNHQKSEGLWLRLAKKDAGLHSVSYKEALDVALCYGWIDGQKKPESQELWLQKFVSRSSRSVWSKINREKALALIASGEMKPAGLEAIENAKKNGRWEAAYDSPCGATVPSRFSSRPRREQEGRRILQDSKQGQHLRHPVADSDRKKSRNPRPQNRTVHRNAGARRKTSPLIRNPLPLLTNISPRRDVLILLHHAAGPIDHHPIRLLAPADPERQRQFRLR